MIHEAIDRHVQVSQTKRHNITNRNLMTKDNKRQTAEGAVWDVRSITRLMFVSGQGNGGWSVQRDGNCGLMNTVKTKEKCGVIIMANMARWTTWILTTHPYSCQEGQPRIVLPSPLRQDVSFFLRFPWSLQVIGIFGHVGIEQYLRSCLSRWWLAWWHGACPCSDSSVTLLTYSAICCIKCYDTSVIICHSSRE